MTSPLYALWLLLRPSPIPPGVKWWRHYTKAGVFGVVFILCLASFNFIVSADSRIYHIVVSEDTSSPEKFALWGPAYQQVKELNLHRDLIKMASKVEQLDANVALVGPDDMKFFLRQVLSSNKINFVSTPCQDCIVLSWVPEYGWEAHYSLPKQGEPAFDPQQQLILLVSSIRQGVAARHDASTPLLLEENQTQQAVRSAVATSLVILPYIAIVFVAWLLVMSMGLIGYRWDIQRSTGKHEPWVSTIHNPWLLYTTLLIRQSLLCFVIFGSVLAVLWTHGLPMSWPWLISLWCALPFLCFLVGQWGVFATVLFHHPNGRMFARFALSPITIGLVWSIRLMVLAMAMRWKQPILAWKSFNELSQSWPYLLIAIPCLVLLSVLMGWLTYLRMGVRRQGLRKTV